tara:strand:+ start:2704 stop:2910 length:207 start_codon:yes stop_codon:yes gene_type:complete
MILEVHYLGNEFVAYDKQGNIIKDRNILNELSFIQPPGFKSVFTVEVKNYTPELPNTNPLAIQLNILT